MMFSLTPPADAHVQSQQALRQYIELERSVLFHALSVADAKAAFALAISLGLAVVQLPHLPAILRGGALTPAHLVALAAEGFLMISGAAAFFAVFPRVSASTTVNDIFWKSSGFLRSTSEFVSKYEQGISADALKTDQLRHLHTLAGICSRKYRSVTVSMWAIPLGLVLLVFSVLLG